MASSAVNVYLHRIHAGRLVRSISGTISFTYDLTYIKRGLPALSISLPLREASYRGRLVKAFFFGELPATHVMRSTPTRQIRRILWNCMPDSYAREHRERYARLSEWKRWSWLTENGMGTGAIDLFPVHVHPSFPHDEIETVLDSKTICQIKTDPKSYASVSGKNCAMPVRMDHDRLVLVSGRGPTLSTHFAKHVGDKDRAFTELFCMRLARSVGIDTPDAEVRFIDGNPCYLIKRYDRVQSGSEIKVLHQESICQALGIPAGVWLERHGAPGTKTILALLRKHSASPKRDRAQYLSRLVFGYLTGCLDINGRNISLVYRNRLPELAPAYDLTIEPSTSSKFPVSVGGIRDPEKVHLWHWRRAVEEDDWTVLQGQMHQLAEECEEQARVLAEQMKREGICSNVCHPICTRISQRVGLIRPPISP